MADVMVLMDAERDALLDMDDELVGPVKEVKKVGKRLRHNLPQHKIGTCFLSLSSSCALPRTSYINDNQVDTCMCMFMNDIYHEYTCI
jgi:hypothetical protein